MKLKPAATILILVLLCITSSSISFAEPPPRQTEAVSFGLNDFVAYWIGSRLFWSGRNPYDAAQITAARSEAGIHEGASDLWNPPWTFFVLYPLSRLSLQSASLMWLWFNITALAVSSLLLAFIFRNRSNLVAAITGALIGALFCGPALDNLWYGQLSLLLTLSFVIFLYLFLKGHEATAGVFLFPILIKPHVFYLVFLALGLWCLRKGRYRALACAAVATVAGAIATWAANPAASLAFLTGAPRPMHLMPATVVTPIRELLLDFTGRLYSWPAFIIPAATAVAFAWVFLRQKSSFEWRERIIPLLCLSFFTAPYGWFFDFAPLLAGTVFTALRALETPGRKRWTLVILLVVLQLSVSLPALMGDVAQHYFFWYPMAVLGLWRAAR